MASNKWLRDYEVGVSRKQGRRRKPTTFVLSETLSPQPSSPLVRPSSSKILTWGEYFEPVEKNYNFSIEAINGHRPRCKRQIENKPVFCDTEGETKLETNTNQGESSTGRHKPESNETKNDLETSKATMKANTIHIEEISTRDRVFNIGGVGRIRSGSGLVQAIGTDEDKQKIPTTILPVRSEASRLLTFDLRMSEASTNPIQRRRPRTVGFKSAVNTIRAAALFDKSRKQQDYAEQLAKPRAVNEKVVTDGRDKTMWDQIELKASREPGPGHYNSEASLKNLEAPSGGKFNLSRKFRTFRNLPSHYLSISPSLSPISSSLNHDTHHP
jgi:hypothetical protein